MLKFEKSEFRISILKWKSRLGIATISGELNAFSPINNTRVRNNVKELIKIFKANPIAKLFALSVVTKKEYKSEKMTDTITAARIPIHALENKYEKTTAEKAEASTKPSMATFITPA